MTRWSQLPIIYSRPNITSCGLGLDLEWWNQLYYKVYVKIKSLQENRWCHKQNPPGCLLGALLQPRESISVDQGILDLRNMSPVASPQKLRPGSKCLSVDALRSPELRKAISTQLVKKKNALCDLRGQIQLNMENVTWRHVSVYWSVPFNVGWVQSISNMFASGKVDETHKSHDQVVY